MPFQIITNDITKVEADAIVNTANSIGTYVGAVDRSIYLAVKVCKGTFQRPILSRPMKI